jgi:hypothetical protein
MSNITVDIPNPSKGGAALQGRNGMAPIKAIEIATYGVNAKVAVSVSIEGISLKGKIINGGFYAVPAEVMDELARQWLKARANVPAAPPAKVAEPFEEPQCKCGHPKVSHSELGCLEGGRHSGYCKCCRPHGKPYPQETT